MGQSIETFERKEVKYRLGAAQHRALWESLEPLLVPDAPAACAEACALEPTVVMSLYYDTPDRALIARSLEKPLYKEKLRVRSYGAPGEAGRVYVELKKKMCGVVYKRRVPMSFAAAQLFMKGMPYEQACAAAPLADPAEDAESHTAVSRQIARELAAFMARHLRLTPSMGTVALRRAYTSDAALPGASVRVTFDEQVRYFDARSDGRDPRDAPFGHGRASQSGAYFEAQKERPCGPYGPEAFFNARTEGFPLLIPGETIMEIKVMGAFPLWLSRILTEAGVRPCSFSKYGQAYLTCRDTAIPARVEDGAGNELPSSLISFPVASPSSSRILSLTT